MPSDLIKIFKILYEKQISEEKNIALKYPNRTINPLENNKYNTEILSIFDQEEAWILNNCKPLFFIEKASDILQETIRNTESSIEKIMIKLLEYNKKNGYIEEVGLNGIRIIQLKRIQFHISEDNTLNINKVVNILSRNRIDFTLKPEIILSLTLTLDDSGGHFALVILKYDSNYGWKIRLVDPYKPEFYSDFFETIIRNIITQLSIERHLINMIDFDNLSSIEGIQNMTYPASGVEPSNDLEKYNLQTENNQDHFCFAWCVYFCNVFLLRRMTHDFDDSIERVKTTYRNISNLMFDVRLAKIKLFIIDLINKDNFLKLNKSNRFFLDKYFLYIWKNTGAGSMNNQTLINIENAYKTNSRNLRHYDLNRFQLYEIEGTLANPIVTNIIPHITIKYFNPVINGLSFDISESRNILNNISPEYIRFFNISNTDNIVKLFYYKLYEINTSNNSTTVASPNNIYNMETDSRRINYFVNNEINPRIIDDCNTNYNAKHMNEYLNLEEYNGGRNIKSCDVLRESIRRRNEKYVNTKFKCKVNDRGLKLTNYQETVYKIMVEKIELTKTEPRSNNPGLLVWYGTGTGKTVPASLTAKMVGYCNNFIDIRNVIIVSPKSAFKNFKKELEDRMGVFLNTLYLTKDSESSFYYNGKNTNIYIFSREQFKKAFEGENNSVIQATPVNFFNDTFLRESLLIVDECHKYNNTELNPKSPEASFMLNCCAIVKQVLLLTATPISNNPEDLEMLLAFLDGRQPIERTKFIKDFLGTYGNPTSNSVNIDENYLSYVNTFTTPIMDKIGNVISKNDLDVKIVQNRTSPDSIFEDHFKNRIVYYMAEEETPNPLPEFIEKVYFAYPNDVIRNNYLKKFFSDIKHDRINKEIESKNTFNYPENLYISNETDINTDAVLKLIRIRETTRPDLNTNYISNTDPSHNSKYNLRRYFSNITDRSFKYIIYCNYKDNVLRIRQKLIDNFVNEDLIGIITGDEITTKREETAKKYNDGEIKIIIISSAAKEGVDFKRTGMLIIYDGIWNASSYEQIIGRAVRKNSNLRINPITKLEDPSIDVYTIIPDIIECYSVLFVCRTDMPPYKYSGDLTQFKIVLQKRAKTKVFTESIRDYFYPIIKNTDQITEASERLITDDNDGRKKSNRKSHRRSHRKSHRRSHRRSHKRSHIRSHRRSKRRI